MEQRRTSRRFIVLRGEGGGRANHRGDVAGNSCRRFRHERRRRRVRGWHAIDAPSTGLGIIVETGKV